MSAETMRGDGSDVRAGTAAQSDIGKLRKDVLKQATASLAAFIGSVNYSESFHMSAAAQGNRQGGGAVVGVAVEDTHTEGAFCDNPLYDISKMGTAVEHANQITKTYGVGILSINIISAVPTDPSLIRSLAATVAVAASLHHSLTAWPCSRSGLFCLQRAAADSGCG